MSVKPSRYHVVYQVFVDRYDPGGPVPAVPERADREGTVRRPFGSPPDLPGQGVDLQGGTLFGIASRVRHIAALADALYLTPITEAPSNHKYDGASFEVLDAHFGGEAGLRALVAATRGAGLALFVDAVLNHVGERHPWARDPRHAGFLRGTAWRGYGNLRELALDEPELRAALFGDGGVVERMIGWGVDGLRLDCANDLGRAVCGEAARAIARAGGRGGAIGEVMAWPGRLLGEGALDGVMGYWLRGALLAALADEGQVYAAARALDRLCAEVPLEHLLRSWTVISSHDTPRVADLVGFDEDRVRLLFALQFAYPGTPMLYYGEEIGLRGGPDPGCRAPMRWDEATWDRQRYELITKLCRLRHTLPALHDGSYVPLPVGAPCLAWARVTDRPEETLLCVANLSPRAQTTRLLLPLDGMYDALPLEDLLGQGRFPIESGCVRVDLPPYGACWLQARDAHPSGYRFLKRA